MKKKLKTAFAVLLAASAFFSCGKEDIRQEPPAIENTTTINVSFRSATRGIIEDAATMWEWESEVNTLQIHVFGADGNLITAVDATESEIATGTVSVPLPQTILGTPCTFYALANCDPVSAKTETAILKQQTYAYWRTYNSTVDEMLAGCANNYGFQMSAVTSAVITDDPATSLTIELKRLMAKIALQFDIAPSVSERNGGGRLVIDQVYLNYATYMVNLFPGTIDGSAANTKWRDPMPFRITDDGVYECLYYAYELDNPRGQQPAIELMGYFDRDGDLNTTDDRSGVLYAIPLDVTGEGKVKRNTVYRITGTITDLYDTWMQMRWRAVDWTENAQEIEFGR